jgi:nicotinamide-nucleotide amidase
MDIEILTIGDELLLGFTIDTNAAFLARELAGVGVRIVRRATGGDDADSIVAAVAAALARTGAVITTGGLGPTSDDLTKPAMARLFGRELRLDEEGWGALRRRWRDSGRSGEIPEANKQQVMFPEGATVLTNRHGSAPGVWLEDDQARWVAMLPGVPREMRGMFADELLPRITARAGEVRTVVRSRTVRTTGIAESRIPTTLGELARGVEGMSLAYLPGEEGVDLRVTAFGVSPDAAEERLASAAAQLRERLGTFAYGEERDDLASVVLALCRTRALRIAVAESCTGGLLGARLTAIPGSSDVVLGGVIAYHDDVKRALLGVDGAVLAARGAVSEPVALAMAGGARRATGAEIGVGITGVAGPGGGSVEKPVGLVWIAIDVAGETRTHGGRFIGDRHEIRFRSTQTALDLVRRALLGAESAST